VAAPAYASVGALAGASSVTSRTPSIPSTRANGNVIIAIVGTKNNATHSVSGSGWVALGTQTNSGTDWTVSLWWRIVDGTEAAPTISWTGAASAISRTVMFTRENFDTANPFGTIGTPGTGTTSTHTSTGFNTTRDNSLVIYIDSAAANTAVATPSGWLERYDTGNASSASRITGGDKTIATSGTASGNISVTGANAAWVQWQIEITEPVAVTHAATGALTGQIGAIAGSAARADPAVTHAATGALTGPGSAIAGSGTRFRAFASSGVLTGQGSTVAGAAARVRAFASTGVLAGQGSTVAGTALHSALHSATGALTGQGSAVAGAAARVRVFASSGALTGQGAVVSGASERIGGSASFDASGALTGQGSLLAGSSARVRQFASTGALTGGGAAVAGVSARTRQYGATGALAGQGSAVAGVSARFRAHGASGVLDGQGAVIDGSAVRFLGAVPHDATGALVGGGASIAGAADRVPGSITASGLQGRRRRSKRPVFADEVAEREAQAKRPPPLRLPLVLPEPEGPLVDLLAAMRRADAEAGAERQRVASAMAATIGMAREARAEMAAIQRDDDDFILFAA
jgi:hypothetical protein